MDLNPNSMNLPNLDELSFLNVLALPNASNNGLVCNTCLSTCEPRLLQNNLVEFFFVVFQRSFF